MGAPQPVFVSSLAGWGFFFFIPQGSVTVGEP